MATVNCTSSTEDNYKNKSLSECLGFVLTYYGCRSFEICMEALSEERKEILYKWKEYCDTLGYSFEIIEPESKTGDIKLNIPPIYNENKYVITSNLYFRLVLARLFVEFPQFVNKVLYLRDNYKFKRKLDAYFLAFFPTTESLYQGCSTRNIFQLSDKLFRALTMDEFNFIINNPNKKTGALMCFVNWIFSGMNNDQSQHGFVKEEVKKVFKKEIEYLTIGKTSEEKTDLIINKYNMNETTPLDKVVELYKKRFK